MIDARFTEGRPRGRAARARPQDKGKVLLSLDARRLLERAALRRPDADAVVDGDRRLKYASWQRGRARSEQGFRGLGVGPRRPRADRASQSGSSMSCRTGRSRPSAACDPVNFRLPPASFATSRGLRRPRGLCETSTRRRSSSGVGLAGAHRGRRCRRSAGSRALRRRGRRPPRPGPGRPRDGSLAHPLYVGYDRPAQGCAPNPQEPLRGRRRARRAVWLHVGRADARRDAATTRWHHSLPAWRRERLLRVPIRRERARRCGSSRRSYERPLLTRRWSGLVHAPASPADVLSVTKLGYAGRRVAP